MLCPAWLGREDVGSVWLDGDGDDERAEQAGRVLACSQRDDDVLEHARGRPVMAGRAALVPWAGWVMKTGDPLCAPFSGGASKARLALHSRVVRSTLGVPSPAQVAALPSACSHRQLLYHHHLPLASPLHTPLLAIPTLRSRRQPFLCPISTTLTLALARPLSAGRRLC